MEPSEEIKYRDDLYEKVSGTIKLTEAERDWLATHPYYNRVLGFPVLNSGIEHLDAGPWFSIRIYIESVEYEHRIIPIVSSPTARGEILTNGPVRNLAGKYFERKSVRILGCELTAGKEMVFRYRSKDGCIALGYECVYFDKTMGVLMSRMSSSGYSALAMLREEVSDTKRRYRCKSPLSDSFDAMIFSIEWSREE